MANFNPLAYTGKITASYTRLGVCQFNASDFSVDENGMVSLGGTGAVQTINSLLPTAGNIVIAGTALQITATSAGSTITLSLPAAITTPGSLTTTSTLSAGTSLSAGTTITAGTGITSTTGNITATAGNVAAGAAVTATTTVTAGTDLISTAGNVIIQGAAKQLQIEGGAVTDFIGTGTLSNGVATILNTNIAATDRVFLQRIAAGASTLLGELSYTINAATSLVVTSLEPGTPADTEVNDQSTFSYFIVRQL